VTATRGLTRSKLVGVLAALTCIALSAAALRASDAGAGYQAIRSRLGEQTATEHGWIRVENVRVGSALRDGSEIQARTPGLYVVVRVTVASTGARAESFAAFEVATRERTYLAYEATTLSPSAGFRAGRDVAFEVDPARIDDLTLHARRQEVVSGYSQHVFVHLGITPGNADRWREAGRGRSVDVRSATQIEALG
jgi:hypothetical protein